MSTTSTLLEVRSRLEELVAPPLDALGCALHWAFPTELEQIEGWGGERRAAWFVNPVDISTDTFTLSGGLAETYTQEIRVACLPLDESTSPREAADRAAELMDAVISAVRDNPKIDDIDGWGAVVLTLAGWAFDSGPQPQGAAGFAAGFNIRIQVEAWTC